MIDKKVLEKIKLENNDLFSKIKNIKKLNIGFTNDVYSCDDYILKVCSNKLNEKEFNNEIDFYLKNSNNNYIPKLIVYHKAIDSNELSYIIIEKFSGKSLYYIWHTLNDEVRKNLVLEISNMMKSFNSIKGYKYDWNKFVTDKIKSSLRLCYDEKLIDDKNYQKCLNVLNKSFKYLNSNNFLLVHSDIHFDNIIITDDKELKIIDFETSLFAPIDYELCVFLRMCNKPFKYANEEIEPYVKSEDYSKIELWLREFYPELFSNRYLDIRMKYYNLEMDLSLLPRFKNDKELNLLVISEIEELDRILKR